MSFCVNCGVKLADYHTNCPLCGTKVINPNETQKEIRRDYPQYRKHLNRKQKNQMRQYLTGWILSMVIALFIAAAVIVDLVISRQITWSVIPVLSLIFLWYTIARPFFGTHNTFHGLFATSSIAIAVYLAILDFILSGRLGWSLIASSSVLFVWAFINGILVSERLKKRIPMFFYYIVITLAYTVVLAYSLSESEVLLMMIIPMYFIVLTVSLLTYFTIKSVSFDVPSLLAVVFISSAVVSVLVELLLSKHISGSCSLSWSLIVCLVMVPLSIISMIIKRITDLRGFVSKKFHR